MAYENLQKKYDLTEAQIEAGIDTVAKNLGTISNIMTLLAVTDLLMNGDIKEEK